MDSAEMWRSFSSTYRVPPVERRDQIRRSATPSVGGGLRTHSGGPDDERMPYSAEFDEGSRLCIGAGVEGKVPSAGRCKR